MIAKRLQTVLDNAKKRASSKQLRLDVDLPFLLWMWDKQKGRCALSGRELVLATHAGMAHQDSPSLDQIVPGAGYTRANVQLVTTQTNLSKSTLSCDEYVELCEQVYFCQKRKQSAAAATSCVQKKAIKITAAPSAGPCGEGQGRTESPGCSSTEGARAATP